MSIINRAVGAAVIALTITSGAAALSSPAGAVARPMSGSALAGFWSHIEYFPGTTAGAQQCHSEGKMSGYRYRCQLYTFDGKRYYALERWNA
ncbi:hypothetical protein ABGB18_47875 [Nonomuraea sp. B12E4]|uniref:hypothetical protein n=1 Tax=Nonomuraea sp. B12E4 TaxID=3153564 RepID=UPI00325CECA3